MGDFNVSKFQTYDFLTRGFWCSQCNDVTDPRRQENAKFSFLLESFNDDVPIINFMEVQSLFFKFVFDDSSEETQLSSVSIMRRILGHITCDVLLETRATWLRCLDFLLLHCKMSVRQAFSREITSFLNGQILQRLFTEGDGSDQESHNFFKRVKNAFLSSEDQKVHETLLLSVSEVMNFVEVSDLLFTEALILLVDHLDNCHIALQITALSLIQISINSHLKCGVDQFLLKFGHNREKFFEHLCVRLLGHPELIKKFSEVVLGVKIEDLINRMAPVIVPRLVLSQRNNDQALNIMHEIAKYLCTDFVLLIVNFLPKVLSLALLRADGDDLSSALEFYHLQTGSDSKEIFSAALPALLDDLVCSMEDEGLDGSHRR